MFRFLPDSETEYPFIHLSASRNQDIRNNDLLGISSLTINLWGTEIQVNEIDSMIYKLRDKLTELRIAESYSVSLSNFNTHELQDMSTGTPLIHVVIEVEFDYTRR